MKLPKDSSNDMRRVFSVSLKHNFILTLAMGITFGFSFACILLNVTTWESSGRSLAPNPIRLIKISRSISDYGDGDPIDLLSTTVQPLPASKSSSLSTNSKSQSIDDTKSLVSTNAAPDSFDLYDHPKDVYDGPHDHRPPLRILKAQSTREIELHSHEGKHTFKLVSTVIFFFFFFFCSQTVTSSLNQLRQTEQK